MRTTTEDSPFEALDECHRQIHTELRNLAALAQALAVYGADAELQRQAAHIEGFFSGTSRQHHADEERNVFPALLVNGNPELVAAVKTLQQDHGWIEENWIELAPQLRAIALGNQWIDPTEFQHNAQVFLDLCQGHIALEESLIYPESKARWAQAVAKRTAPKQR
jgi:hemerythrin-like domain-containing protein